MAPAIAPVPVPGVLCRVCGCAQVRTDEVMHGEVLFLAECPRCDHRWTARATLPHVRKVALRSRPSAQELTAA